MQGVGSSASPALMIPARQQSHMPFEKPAYDRVEAVIELRTIVLVFHPARRGERSETRIVLYVDIA